MLDIETSGKMKFPLLTSPALFNIVNPEQESAWGKFSIPVLFAHDNSLAHQGLERFIREKETNIHLGKGLSPFSNFKLHFESLLTDKGDIIPRRFNLKKDVHEIVILFSVAVEEVSSSAGITSDHYIEQCRKEIIAR